MPLSKTIGGSPSFRRARNNHVLKGLDTLPSVEVDEILSIADIVDLVGVDSKCLMGLSQSGRLRLASPGRGGVKTPKALFDVSISVT